MKTFGEQLRSRREALGLTLLEAALRLNTYPTKLSRIETGLLRPPDLATVIQWTGELGMAGTVRRELLTAALAHPNERSKKATRQAAEELDAVAKALTQDAGGRGVRVQPDSGPRTLGEVVAQAVGCAIDRNARSITVRTADGEFKFQVGE